jgi:hypothetical protein
MILALLGPLLHAFSGGGGTTGSSVQLCDAINICGSPGTYTAGRRLGHTGPRPVYYCPQGMHLVAPPERTTVYTLRTGDANLADDPSAYVPGELLTLFVRVTHRMIPRKMDAGRTILSNESSKYIGLLLYAVQLGDSSETKIGYAGLARMSYCSAAPRRTHPRKRGFATAHSPAHERHSALASPPQVVGDSAERAGEILDAAGPAEMR